MAAADRTLREVAETYEIIIVNDGSRDETGTELEALARRYPSLRVITHPTNRGYGAAVRTALLAARYETIFFSDSDGQFDLGELGRLVAELPNADVVIGYRAARQDRANRLVAAWLWNKLVAGLFSLPYRDIDCAFKLFRRTALERAGLAELRSTGAMISAELLVKLRATGARVVEVPVSHYPRRVGTATGGQLRVIARAFRELWRFYWDDGWRNR